MSLLTKLEFKKDIQSQLIKTLKDELSLLEASAHSSRELATSDESKPEGKYDTRAIEASYLAGAQAKRVEEIKLDLQMLEELDLSYAPKLQLGSLGKIRCNNMDRYYFISAASGGTLLESNGESVLVISVFSPIGSEALGLSVGEEFEVETPKNKRSYEVIEIY